ncbi:MAG: hypothetical protein E7A54_15890 [Morganella morganii]|nr:hypothetical protein [Morganella morganii]MDU1074856.1 hypothetical protein [Morganella morganii]
MKKNLSALSVAKLIILNAFLYATEKDKSITRYKISNTTLRKMSLRNSLRERFLDEVKDELADLGWIMVRNNNDENCFMVMDATENWPKLSAKRLSTILEQNNESEIDDMYSHHVEGEF